MALSAAGAATAYNISQGLMSGANMVMMIPYFNKVVKEKGGVEFKDFIIPLIPVMIWVGVTFILYLNTKK